METTPPSTKTADSPIAGAWRIDQSLLREACSGNSAALVLMFRQFIPTEETVLRTDYLGVQGFWGGGMRSFACLTDRRLCGLRVGKFGEVIYQDGFLEHINSGVVYQPSRFALYLFLIISTVVGLLLSGFTVMYYQDLQHKNRRAAEHEEALAANPQLAKALSYEYYYRPSPSTKTDYILLLGLLILTPLTFPVLWTGAGKLYFRFWKCGVVLWVREGVSIYFFTNRKLLLRANQLYRETALACEKRNTILRSKS